MSDDNVVPFKPPRPPGYSSLSELPQAPPISETAYSSTWWELDQIFKLYLGQFVVISGLAGSGKSTFILNVLLNQAVDIGLQTFMYVPENETELLDKARKIWCANPQRTPEGFDYFAKHQWFIQSSIVEDGNPRDMDWVLGRAEYAIKYDNCSVVLIDPWNELERIKPRDWLMTDYIGHVIGWMKDLCRKYYVTVIIVAHPTKAVNEAGRVPNLYDIEGSANWANKADNGLIIHREKTGNRCTVASVKVRYSPDAGRLGSCHFIVDPKTGLFTPQHGGVDLL